mgnify:CR=1 FL=1
MKTVAVDVETLIHEIEEMKRVSYESLSMADGLENPDVLAQTTSRLLGEQAAFDCVIRYLRELQGCDPE